MGLLIGIVLIVLIVGGVLIMAHRENRVKKIEARIQKEFQNTLDAIRSLPVKRWTKK